MSVNEIGRTFRGELKSYLSDKPIWAFWIAFSAFTGVLFGIFYTVFYLLGLQWKVAALLVLVIGMIRGSSVYSHHSPKREAKKEEKVA